MFSKKRTKIEPADLIDLLLSADLETRSLLVMKALESGVVDRREAQDICSMVARLELAASASVSSTPPDGVLLRRARARDGVAPAA